MVEDSTESGFTLRELSRVLRRHKKKVLAVLLLTMALTAAVVVAWPRTYISKAQLYLRVGRESVALDPTATTGKTIGFAKSHEVEVNSVLQILKSQVVSEKVVDAVGVDRILGKSAAQTPPSGLSTWMTYVTDSIRGLDPVGDRERAVAQVRSTTQFTVVPLSNVNSVSATARSPRLAQEILDNLLESFLDEHLRVNRTQGSDVFFAEQVALLRGKLDSATGELRDAKNRYGLLTIEAQRSILSGQIREVENQVFQSQTALAYSEARGGDLKATVDRLPGTVDTQRVSGIGHEATDGIRQQLFEIEVRERRLLAIYTEDHPLMQQMRQQRRELEAIFKEQPDHRTHSTTALNQTRQTLHQELLAEAATAAALRGKNVTLAEQRHQLQKDLETLNNHEVQIAQLQRRCQLLTSSHRAYSENLEQVRIDRAIEDDRISSISIVHPPTFIERPVSPRIALTLAVGVFLSVSLSVVLVVVAEYFDQSLKTPAQVESQFQVPVLLSIPRRSRRPMVRI